MANWYFDREPYEVQTVSLQKMNGEDGYGIFLEPGLGKTAITISDFLRNYEEGEVSALIVVCPNSLKSNWRAEFMMSQFRDKLPVHIWPDDLHRHHYKTIHPGIFIFNYEALLSEETAVLFESLLRNQKCYVALDESSRVKNPVAKTTKRLIKWAPLAVIRRCLTGTPFTQSVLDLWSQIKFCKPEFKFSPYQFKLTFAVMGGYMGKQIMGVQNERRLHDILDKMSFRARKEDYLDLPEKIYKTIETELSPRQAEMYRRMRYDFFLQLEQGEVTAPLAITQLSKLMQISRGFVHDDDGKIVELVAPEKNPVIQGILETVEATPGKVVIMTRHVYFTDMVITALEKAGYKVAYIRGGMTADEVQNQKELFNNDPEYKTIVTQIEAGSMGHTLLGEKEFRCSTMIFGENVFSLEKRIQAEDRIHRIGQDRACLYVDFIGTSIDFKIVASLQKKQQLAHRVVDMRALFGDGSEI